MPHEGRDNAHMYHTVLYLRRVTTTSANFVRASACYVVLLTRLRCHSSTPLCDFPQLAHPVKQDNVTPSRIGTQQLDFLDNCQCKLNFWVMYVHTEPRAHVRYPNLTPNKWNFCVLNLNGVFLLVVGRHRIRSYRTVDFRQRSMITFSGIISGIMLQPT